MFSILRYCQTHTFCVFNLQISHPTQFPQNPPQTYKYWVLQAVLQRWKPLLLQWWAERQDLPSPLLLEEVLFTSSCSMLWGEVIDQVHGHWQKLSPGAGTTSPVCLKEILLVLGIDKVTNDLKFETVLTSMHIATAFITAVTRIHIEIVFM